MDPKNDMQVRTVRSLLDRVAENGDPADAAEMAMHLKRIRPTLITNMAQGAAGQKCRADYPDGVAKASDDSSARSEAASISTRRSMPWFRPWNPSRG
jgi:hypothetical protein